MTRAKATNKPLYFASEINLLTPIIISNSDLMTSQLFTLLEFIEPAFE